MKLVDTHTHLYLEEFSVDRNEVVNRAVKEGVVKLLLPNISSGSVIGMMDMCEIFSGICIPMIGLHPNHVDPDYKNELKALEKHLDDNRIVAIGETGIDLFRGKAHAQEQNEAFIVQVRWAIQKKLPLVIHSRDSFGEIFKVLDKYAGTGLSGVFHCFTGTTEEVKIINNYGFYFGINGIITYKNSGLGDVVKNIPPERLLLETDSPYLTPVPHRGKRNESSFLRHTAEKLAAFLQISIDEVAEVTTGNAVKLFNLT